MEAPKLATEFESAAESDPVAVGGAFTDAPPESVGFWQRWRSAREQRLHREIRLLKTKVEMLEMELSMLGEVVEHQRRWLEASTQAAVRAAALAGFDPRKGGAS